MVQREGQTDRECRTPGHRACRLVLLASIAACLTVAAGTAAPVAHADRSFAPRFTTTDRGQVLMAANTVLTCPGTGAACKAAQAGTSSRDNGDFAMAYTDVDSDGTTFNSSRPTPALPPGSTLPVAALHPARHPTP